MDNFRPKERAEPCWRLYDQVGGSVGEFFIDFTLQTGANVAASVIAQGLALPPSPIVSSSVDRAWCYRSTSIFTAVVTRIAEVGVEIGDGSAQRFVGLPTTAEKD